MLNKQHTTTQGEAWDQIALAEYDAEAAMGDLLWHNIDEMDALTLSGDIDVAVPSVGKAEAPRVLPPWERL